MQRTLAPSKMLPSRLVVLFASCCLFSGSVQAHVDTTLLLRGDKLLGLPETFSPAVFDRKLFRLRIKNHQMVFSPFLRSLFETSHKLVVSASWYHTGSTLPPYILFSIYPKGKDFSYKILLELETLALIEVSVQLRESDDIRRDLQIQLDERLLRDIDSSVSTLE